MKQQGLTLLEVMAAVAIFALTATAIMKATTDHLRGIGYLEEITFATWVANNRLSQLQIENTWPPQNNKTGSMEMGGNTWYWKQQVVETQDSDLRQIEVIVSSDEEGEFVAASVISYVANPKPTRRSLGNL